MKLRTLALITVVVAIALAAAFLALRIPPLPDAPAPSLPIEPLGIPTPVALTGQPMPTRVPGWEPPAWPDNPSTAERIPAPEFRITDWNFPNLEEIYAFYWSAPLHERFAAVRGTSRSLGRLSLRNARELASSCPDTAIRSVILAQASRQSTLTAPVLLHRVRLPGKDVWVLVTAWEVAAMAGSLTHIEITVLEPGTAEVLGSVRCG